MTSGINSVTKILKKTSIFDLETMTYSQLKIDYF